MLLLEWGANDVRDIYRSASDVPTATLESKRQAFDKICENFSPGECSSIISLPTLLPCNLLLFYYGHSHRLFAKLFDSSSWNILSRQWRHGTPPEHYTPDLVLSIPLSVTYLGLVIVTHQIFLSTQRLAKWCILILA
jgi:hypothetical protein